MPTFPWKTEYASDSITVKIRIGEICLSLYFIENHRPITNNGKEAHHTIISGRVILWRRDTICHGNGAKSKYNKPTGIVAKAP